MLVSGVLVVLGGCGAGGESIAANDVEGGEVSEVEETGLDESFETTRGISGFGVGLAVAIEDTIEFLDDDSVLGLDGRAFQDCKDIDFVGDGVLRIDFSACEHVRGTVRLERIESGLFLLEFEEGFAIAEVDVSGFLLLDRQELGSYLLGTTDESGGEMGNVPVLLNWEGARTTIEREVFLTGEIRATDPLWTSFSVTGSGSLERTDGSSVFDLGLGGASGDNLLLFPRPVEGSCPDDGVLDIEGTFVLEPVVVLSFTVRGRTHSVVVGAGSLPIDAMLSLRFDGAAADGIGALAFAPKDVIVLPDTAILDAVESSDLADEVKNAITTWITTGQGSEDSAWRQITGSMLEDTVAAGWDALLAPDGLCIDL